MGIGAVYNDEQWHWISKNLGQYNPLCEHLQTEFGTEFLIEHSSGGCHSLVGRFSNGHMVMVTMAIDVLSTYAEHAALEAAGEEPGWAAAIYSPADEYSEAISWAADRSISIIDFAGVTSLIHKALAEANGQHTLTQ